MSVGRLMQPSAIHGEVVGLRVKLIGLGVVALRLSVYGASPAVIRCIGFFLNTVY
jgi:hypothetical protein